MMKSKIFAVLIVLFFSALACRREASSPTEETTHTIAFDGMERSYILHVPASYSGDNAAPLGLGPAKGKDFASSLGPVIVTREAIADKAVDRPGVYDLNVPAKVNDVEMSKGNLKDIFWSFGEITARASDTVDLMPGVVELEIERIGNLKNSIGGKKK